MAFPHLFAGQRLTALMLQSMQMQEVVQGTTQTVNNSTTFVDTNLTMEAEPGATYWYSVMGSYTTSETADIKFQWVAPTNGEVARFVIALGKDGAGGASSPAQTFTDVLLRRPGTATDVHAGGWPDVATAAYYEFGVILGGDGGAFTLQFAQSVAEASDTDFTASSRLMYLRVG